MFSIAVRQNRKQFFDIIFQNMYQIQVQSLKSLLRQPQITQQALTSILQNLEKHFDMQKLFAHVAQLAKNMSNNVQPFVRVNSIAVASHFLKLAHYPYLLLAEIYLMPHIQNIIEFATINTSLQKQSLFFKQSGYSPNIPHLQNLSYNYVTACCNFVQVAASIKPLKVYQGRENSQSSAFKKSCEKLFRNNQNNQFALKLVKNKQTESLRENYLYSLSKWNEYQGDLLQFYVKIVEQYLCTGTEQKKYDLGFNQMLKYGEPTITSEIIARLIEIVSSSCNFKVRTRALKLLDNLILWGDVQALLVVNFTQHIQIVVKNIMYVHGETSINEGAKIYPQISEQEEEKLQFYIVFLRCIQTWAECYPKNDYFDYQNKRKHDESVIHRLYRFLKQNKKFKFPQNLVITRFEKESHTNMKEKMIRNQMILIDINGQAQSVSILLQDSKSFQQVQQFYENHKQLLLLIINNQESQLNQNMTRLFNFKLNFENYVQSIQSISNMSQDIDLLIENGLELIDLIELVHQSYVKYLKGQYVLQQFKQAMVNACFKYFSSQSKIESQVYFRRFLSEKLKIKRDQLSLSKIRSVPQQNELKLIVNDLNIRQLRNKYKKKRERAQDTRSSQSSVLSLEIYTRTKFSKNSAEGNQDSSLKQNSLKKIVEESYSKKNRQICKGQNLKTEGKGGSKKKITIVSKQLCRSQVSNKAVNDELKNSTESSKQSQISTDGTNNNKPQNKIQNRRFNIALEQNERYYEYLKREEFKYSYTLAHIIIFRSEELTIQRVICQIIQNNKIRLKVLIVIIPLIEILSLNYMVQYEGCIQITDRTQNFSKRMTPFTRYVIELVGQMKKIPLKLPNITICVGEKVVMNYILPFTINFFLDCYSNQTQVLSNFRSIENNSHYEFISQRFRGSSVLFPQDNLDQLFIYFPFMVKLSKLGDKKDLFIWQVKHNDLKFLIIVQYFQEQKEMRVKLCTSVEAGEAFLAFFKYLLNWFAHLLRGFSLSRS